MLNHSNYHFAIPAMDLSRLVTKKLTPMGNQPQRRDFSLSLRGHTLSLCLIIPMKNIRWEKENMNILPNGDRIVYWGHIKDTTPQTHHQLENSTVELGASILKTYGWKPSRSF